MRADDVPDLLESLRNVLEVGEEVRIHGEVFVAVHDLHLNGFAEIHGIRTIDVDDH